MLNRKYFTHNKHSQPLRDFNTTMVDGSRHYITPDGVFPSVTTVLKHLSHNDIEKWKARVGEVEAARISNIAATRGENLHKMCEHYLNNSTKYLDEKYAMDAYTFEKMKPYLNKIDNIFGLETALYSKQLRLAGRTDCIALYNGIPSIIDFKTSTKIKKRDWIYGYFIQETAYSVMFQENYHRKIKQIVTLIANDVDPIAQEFIENPDDWKQPLKEAILQYRRINQPEINIL